MKTTSKRLQAIALIATATASLTTFAQPQSELSRHIEAATKNAAGNVDLLTTYRPYYCMFAEDRLDLQAAARNDRARVPLTQIFDDTWYIGSRYVGQFIVKTAQGFMVADSLNNAAEAAQYTTPALLSLGLSPSLPLTDVYLTHGHGDHDGGALYLKQTYGANVYVGSGDGLTKPYSPILVDSSERLPQPASMAGRTVTLLATPGHSPGAVTAVIPVTDGGRPINAIVVGGSSMPNNIAGARQYLDSVERTYGMALKLNVEASMHPHPVFDGTLRNLDKIAASGKTTPSPFTIGRETALRGLVIYRECSAAWVSKLDPTANIPVWRTTKLEFQPASPTPTRVAARLSNDWGPLANQSVTFTEEASGSTCPATTDANGVATCNVRFGPFPQGTSRITAAFAGASGAEAVDLVSSVTSAVGNGCSDLLNVKSVLGARRGDSRFSERLDMDGNGVIDIRDVAAIARLVPGGTSCQ